MLNEHCALSLVYKWNHTYLHTYLFSALLEHLDPKFIYESQSPLEVLHILCCAAEVSDLFAQERLTVLVSHIQGPLGSDPSIRTTCFQKEGFSHDPAISYQCVSLITF